MDHELVRFSNMKVTAGGKGLAEDYPEINMS